MRAMRSLAVVLLSASLLLLTRSTVARFSDYAPHGFSSAVGTRFGARVGGIDISELEVHMSAGCEEGQECEVRVTSAMD